MTDIRWKQRFENYQKALGRLDEALNALNQEPSNHLYQMDVIHGFKLSSELGWKVLSDYLKFQGVQDVTLPRDVVRQAFQAQLILDGQTWIDMLEARNKTSHTYDDAQAAKIVEEVTTRFFPVLRHLQDDFLGKL